MFTNKYNLYALVTLTTVYTLSFMDRFMIGMLMQPIKEELELSDTQLGWRWAFLLVGLPGLLMAVVVRLTLREPRRHSINPAPLLRCNP